VEDTTGAAATDDELAVASPLLGDEDSMGAPPAEENAAVDVGAMEYGSAVEE